MIRKLLFLLKYSGVRNTQKLIKKHLLKFIFSKWPCLNKNKIYLVKNGINIGFIVAGGLGDYLIFANYLQYVKNKFAVQSISFSVFFEMNFQYAELLSGDAESDVFFYKIRELYGRKEQFDVLIKFSMFPEIIFEKLNCNDIKNTELAEYIYLCYKFQNENPELFQQSTVGAEYIAFAKRAGYTRLNISDIYSYLGINQFLYRLYPGNEYENPEIAALVTGKIFCTIHRGTDISHRSECVKLWDVQSYNFLIARIKQEYPSLLLIQIGVSERRCPRFENIDFSFVGKTSFLDICKLLNESCLHIDCEGGFIHLRQALHAGKSICLFGPTDLDYYGYKDNYNIRGAGCTFGSCESKSVNWMFQCAAGYDEARCMKNITVEEVMRSVKNALKGVDFGK